jgi:hypothetical protein
VILFPRVPIRHKAPQGVPDFYKIFSIAIILVSNILQYSLKPTGFRQGDSWAYGFTNERNWELISFSGHALRKWPLVLANTLLGDVQLQVLFQTVFSCFAWILLVHVVSRSYGGNNPAIIAIGILGSLRQIVSWNSIQLSESWSISSVIVVISLSISLSAKYSRKKTMAFLVFLLIALNTKSSTLLAVTLFLPILFLLMIVFKQTQLLLKRKFLAVAVIAILGYSGFLNVNQARENLQNEGTGQSYAAAQSSAVISDINPEASTVINAISNVKQVSCLDLSKVKSPQEITESMKFGCKESEEWLTNHFATWYLKFLISNPKYVIKIFAISLSAGNSPYSMYGGSISIIPEPFDQIFFGSRNYANRLNQDSAQNIEVDKVEMVSPLFGWLISGFLILLLASRRVVQKSSAHVQSSITAFGFLICLGLITTLISGVLIPNEWFRQSIVGQVQIFLGTILLYAEYSKTISKTNARNKD